MPFADGTPTPDEIAAKKRAAEVNAEVTPRDELDEVNDANPWIRWTALVGAVALIAGGLIRWCNAT